MIRNSQARENRTGYDDQSDTTIEPAVKQTYGRNLESSLNFGSSPVS